MISGTGSGSGAGVAAGAGVEGTFAAVADAVLRGVVLTHPLAVGGLIALAAVWAGRATRPEPARRRVMALAAALTDTAQAAAATAVVEAEAHGGRLVGGPFAAGLRLRRLRRAGVPHPDRVAAELAVIVEVMTVALTSGLSITASLQMALDHRDADSSTGRWLARLATPDRPLDEALDSFGRTCGPRARAFAATVTGSMRTGLPLAQELDRLGRELRDDLRRQTERKVRRLPVLLLFPLVLCVLPALGLVAIVPVLVAAFGA